MNSTAAVSALVISLAIGAATSGFFYVVYLLKEMFYRRMLTQITISNSDPCYKWLLNFLIKSDYLNKSMSDCVVKIVKKKRNWYEPKQ